MGGETFLEEEVKVAVWDLEGDNALGPDGFPIAFYTSCWEVVKDDLMQVFDDFFQREFLDKGSNATYIFLIPKKEGIEELGDFRPISHHMHWYKEHREFLVVPIRNNIGDSW